MRRWKIILSTVIAAIVAVAALGHPVRWTEAALLMVDIAAGGAHSPWQDLTSMPTSTSVRWTIADRTIEADLYAPASTARAVLLLVPGAAVLGRTEPRLVALARSIARAGFIVMVPEVPGMRRLALSRADADVLADALRALHPRYPRLPLGVMAISYGVGPAVIATLEPDINGKVDFIVGIGAYHNTDEVIRFITTGAYRRMGDGRLHRMTPNRYGRWAFLSANAERLPDPTDTDLLRQAAERKLADPAAATSDLRVHMSSDARAVLDLMENDDPDRVPALLAALPEPVRTHIDALNLALHDLRSVKAKLILIHGRDDPMIPFTESEALAAAAPHGTASLYLIESIGHVEFDSVSLANAWTMWSATNRVLLQRRP
ncbi:RNA methyltransferase [Reyranella sp. CPCC 100927]|uniref:RNA methyltransferase n=1 Tax=Reyranella sp. CPCC 100927 TaxID=2599616 RepID=UPI0011B85120|nr:RNA methyltransferase [Reyranella sp. CPCC 100927]TWT05758.1 RNA methyltransferase [Reyranella sp. CPCC 100927]